MFGTQDGHRRHLVRQELAKSDVYVLGVEAPEDPLGADILHITTVEVGNEYEVLPIFTDPGLALKAKADEPEWESLQILLVNGGALLKAEDATGMLLINPGSDSEFKLPVSSGTDELPEGRAA